MKQKDKASIRPMMCVYAGPDSRYWKTRDPADVNVTDKPDQPAVPLTVPGLGMPDEVRKTMDDANKAAPADNSAAPAPDALPEQSRPATTFVYAAPAQPAPSVGQIGDFAPAAPKTKFCPACGAPNLLTHKFCTECGARFTYPDSAKRDV